MSHFRSPNTKTVVLTFVKQENGQFLLIRKFALGLAGAEKRYEWRKSLKAVTDEVMVNKRRNIKVYLKILLRLIWNFVLNVATSRGHVCPNCGYSIANQEPTEQIFQPDDKQLPFLTHEAEKQTKSDHLRLIDIISLSYSWSSRSKRLFLDWSEAISCTAKATLLRLSTISYAIPSQ